MGKGDKRRPTVVSDELHQTRWDRAFSRRPKKVACLTCGRTHRDTPYCCYECQKSGGAEHSIGCDITWREKA